MTGQINDKCPACKGTGMGQFDHNKNARCDACNGTGEKKLDSPDKETVRLELARILLDFERDDSAFSGTITIDKIIALIEPLIKDAREQERNRVLGILIKEYPAIDTWKCWPDLKAGK